ncbi:PREDICTED: uncharacterized protein LOC108561964 [Nicrophorus vespilloides]|uniref:Uncharacterized protein LOC108561964 n=1 Tax=Nicrophorus vespilloides TaxID=110193 RepID=A0ABM1MM09_NICVS|nr:PREDICTED: uncharacterized protein LOC108561964 [Nicrophorus vespilloides]
MSSSTMLYATTLTLLLTLVQCNEFNSINSRAIDTKGMLTSLATSLMSRGYGTTGGGSQVVSLNLTNLLVLVLLKALIFAAGSLGAGTWKGGYGRSADGEEYIVTEEEILMYLSYLTGSPGNNGCLQNIACRQPHQAKRYTAAGEMLLKASKMVNPEPSANYEFTLQEVQEAVKYGMAGGNCKARYNCGNRR